MSANPVDLHPLGCFARLAAARARRGAAQRRRVAAENSTTPCTGCCALVDEQVWDALDRAYPELPLEGAGQRRALALLFAPLMALRGWRFCACYSGSTRPTAEHRFIASLVDTVEANSAAGALAELHRDGFFNGRAL